MALTQIDLTAATTMVLAVWMCGIADIKTQLRGLALQTFCLALICVLIGADGGGWHYFILAAAIVFVKAIGIPGFLSWAANRIGVRRDSGTYFGSAIALGFGCILLVAGMLTGRNLANPDLHASGAAGMAVALLFIGMLLMITRRLALSQLIGLLTLENGILLYGLTQTRGMPLMIEMGAVFEVLVGVLISGLVIFRLNRSFEHVDVTDLRRLRR